MDKKSKDRLTDLVQDATPETVQSLTCPACSGGLLVQFVPKGARGKGAGALYVTCAECRWRVISDGIPTEPPWVLEIGLKVQTGKKQASRQG